MGQSRVEKKIQKYFNKLVVFPMNACIRIIEIRYHFFGTNHGNNFCRKEPSMNYKFVGESITRNRIFAYYQNVFVIYLKFIKKKN